MKKTRLFFDTETTGLFRGLPKAINFTEFDNCRLVEFGYRKMRGNDLIAEGSIILKNDGYTIPSFITKIHGINDEMANRDGLSRHEFFLQLIELLEGVDYLIAHNMPFDIRILAAECYRYNQEEIIEMLKNIKRHCSLEMARKKIKKTEIENHKLQTVYKHLFNKEFDGAHRALNDVHALCSIYKKLIKIDK